MPAFDAFFPKRSWKVFDWVFSFSDESVTIHVDYGVRFSASGTFEYKINAIDAQ